MTLQEALEKILGAHRQESEGKFKELSDNEIVEQCSSLSEVLFDTTGLISPMRGSEEETEMLAALGGRILMLLAGKR